MSNTKVMSEKLGRLLHFTKFWPRKRERGLGQIVKCGDVEGPHYIRIAPHYICIPSYNNHITSTVFHTHFQFWDEDDPHYSHKNSLLKWTKINITSFIWNILSNYVDLVMVLLIPENLGQLRSPQAAVKRSLKLPHTRSTFYTTMGISMTK